MSRRRRNSIRVNNIDAFTHVYYHVPKRYGIFAFAFDAALTILTSGLWLIWVFVREMRKR